MYQGAFHVFDRSYVNNFYKIKENFFPAGGPLIPILHQGQYYEVARAFSSLVIGPGML